MEHASRIIEDSSPSPDEISDQTSPPSERSGPHVSIDPRLNNEFRSVSFDDEAFRERAEQLGLDPSVVSIHVAKRSLLGDRTGFYDIKGNKAITVYAGSEERSNQTLVHELQHRADDEKGRIKIGLSYRIGQVGLRAASFLTGTGIVAGTLAKAHNIETASQFVTSPYYLAALGISALSATGYILNPAERRARAAARQYSGPPIIKMARHTPSETVAPVETESDEERLEAARELGRELYNDLSERQANLHLDVHEDKAEVQSIMDRLRAIGELLETPGVAPFEKRTKRVPKSEIEQYLSKKRYAEVPEGRRGFGLDISSPDTTKISVPVALITSAAKFDSWLGREGGSGIKKYTKDRRDTVGTSIDVMSHYASLPTPIPPVTKLRLYVQPDGQIFGDNDSGDSHRIGAAYLRGDTMVNTYHLSITKLEENSISDHIDNQ